MMRWLLVLCLAGCLDGPEDPRPGPPDAELDGGRFNPDLVKPGGGGYGSGSGSGSGSGAPPSPDVGLPADAARDAGDAGDAGP